MIKWSRVGLFCASALTITIADPQISPCFGPSMEPTFRRSGDFVLHFGGLRNSIQSGHVVVFRDPTNYSNLLVKRVISIPGQSVCPKRSKNMFILPHGFYWVQGDNWSNSFDSNSFGPLPTFLVKSRAVMIIWPLNRIDFVK